MSSLQGVCAVLRKDLQLELRSRYVLSVLGVFVLSTLLLVLVAAGRERFSPQLEAGLLWIVILFASALGLGRAFVSENERGTVLLLRLHTTSTMVYAGKLGYSLLTVLCINALVTGAFVWLMGIQVQAIGLLVLTLILGTVGLSGATTLLAAIIARTRRSGPLLPMLLFPLLLPLLLPAVQATGASFSGGSSLAGAWTLSVNSLVVMGSFAGVVIAASVLLFDYVWAD